jgi:enamine deaminase RidA (YjgF/YER057c/UK114 family)
VRARAKAVCVWSKAMTAETRLTELGIELPPVAPPSGNFVRARQVGNVLYLSGHGPVHADGNRDRGKVGSDLTVDQAKESARLVALNLLATARAYLGDLDRVTGIVKVLGMVNSAPGFDRQPAVIDGCSDLLVDVFGEAGRHTRSAVGMAELPFGIPVEIEMILEIDDAP